MEVIILANDNEQSQFQKSDSENIITLLLLRAIFDEHCDEHWETKLITEV